MNVKLLSITWSYCRLWKLLLDQVFSFTQLSSRLFLCPFVYKVTFQF